MLKDFVLGTEIAREGKFDIANISMVIKGFDLVEGSEYLKYGGVTLLNRTCPRIPLNVMKVMYSDKMSDLSEYLPFNYFMDLMENQTRMIKDKFEIVKVSGKKFIKVTDENLNEVLMNDKLVKYTVDAEEIPELVNKKYIEGHLKLSNKKYLTWY